MKSQISAKLPGLIVSRLSSTNNIFVRDNNSIAIFLFLISWGLIPRPLGRLKRQQEYAKMRNE
jgi:hypothetical protein